MPEPELFTDGGNEVDGRDRGSVVVVVTNLVTQPGEEVMPSPILGHVIENGECKEVIRHAVRVCATQSVIEALHVVKPACDFHAGLAPICDNVTFKGRGPEGIPGLINGAEALPGLLCIDGAFD